MNVNSLFLSFILVFCWETKGFTQQFIPIDVGGHTQTDSSFTQTYGYWFEASSCFRITGVRVPTDLDSVNRTVQVVALENAPPAFPDMTNEFESLAYFVGVQDTNILQTDIVVSTGDKIGVFGGGNVEQMVHSMHLGAHSTVVNGGQIDFNRLVYEGDLNTGEATEGLYTESISLGYSRIEMYYDTDIEIVADFSYDVDLTEVEFYDESNGGDTYLWNFGDGATSTEQDPVHDFGSLGTYIVSLQVTDICGTDEFIDTIEVRPVSLPGLVGNPRRVMISPNPSEGIFSVTSSNNIGNIKVSDITGKTILEQNISVKNWTLDLKKFPEGMYFLKTKNSVEKLILIDSN